MPDIRWSPGRIGNPAERHRIPTQKRCGNDDFDGLPLICEVPRLGDTLLGARCPSLALHAERWTQKPVPTHTGRRCPAAGATMRGPKSNGHDKAVPTLQNWEFLRNRFSTTKKQGRKPPEPPIRGFAPAVPRRGRNRQLLPFPGFSRLRTIAVDFTGCFPGPPGSDAPLDHLVRFFFTFQVKLVHFALNRQVHVHSFFRDSMPARVCGPIRGVRRKPSAARSKIGPNASALHVPHRDIFCKSPYRRDFFDAMVCGQHLLHYGKDRACRERSKWGKHPNCGWVRQ